MHVNKRLEQAFTRAKIKKFDDHSNFIFFSDLHRGNDSVSDEFTRNQVVLLHALDYYYHNNYTYVEVGDGDELWEYKDFKYIRQAHGDVFTALKKFYDKKRLIILYGNHNILLRNKKYVKKNYYVYYDEYQQQHYNLFPGIKPLEALILKHQHTGQEIFILHGHQGDLLNDQLWPISMLALRYFWRYLHLVGFRNPSSPAKNLYKRHKVERAYLNFIRHHKRILICGHTHRPKFPQPHRLPYFNTGCCIHTKGITGIEITNGKILMVDWRTRANETGALEIVRTVVRGPEPIKTYY